MAADSDPLPHQEVEAASNASDMPGSEAAEPGASAQPVRTPLFLHRETYKRRRVMDAARLLPFLGTALMLLPMLWAESHLTSMGAVYLFLAWLFLILAGAVLARRLAEPLRGTAQAAHETEP